MNIFTRWLLFALLICFNDAHAEKKVEVLKQFVCQVRPTIEGWCSEEKALSFIDLVLDVKPDVCVEVGVFGGSSLFPVATTLKFLNHGIIVAIDPWDKIECLKYLDPLRDQHHLQWWGMVNMNYIYYSFKELLQKHGIEKYCQIIRETSEKAAPMVDTIDILYLDGNHSEVVSTQDVQLYLPKVRHGGFIWMNDTLWTDRQDAIDLLLEACDVVKLIDNGNCILFKKR